MSEPSVVIAEVDRLSRSGRYRGIALIGQGGMGCVYKAWDEQLKRIIALKCVRKPDPAVEKRLLAEAQAQARIDHPNVCRVYEVGHIDGELFIGMQFIDGETLHDLMGTLALEEKVLVAAQVADGLQAAHRLGIVHRDVKPSNIIVERTERGLVPFITDFGLARDLAAPGVTKAEVVMGTPSYMAPEQARGDSQAIDRRTDVFALGATLYEVLSGRQAFGEGSDLQVLYRTVNEEPAPLRGLPQKLPRDLIVIVEKCLEKDPERRYDSAAALADDLRRWLNGDPIAARPSGPVYRVWKHVGKHRTASAAVAISAVAALVAGALAVRARIEANERTALAQRFSTEIDQAEVTARLGHLSPLHDTRPEKAVVRARIRSIEQQMNALGSAAVGPGEVAMGRGHLILGEPDVARAHLEKAWADGLRTPQLHAALGEALGQLYQKALEELDRAPSRDLRESQRIAIDATIRDPALSHLREAEAGGFTSALNRGRVALHEHRWAEAVDLAEKAAGETPWAYEAWRLAGDAHVQIASAVWRKGDAEAANRQLAQAGAAYLKASEIARSDARTHLGECRRQILTMSIERARTMPLAATAVLAAAACDRALAADPDLAAEALARKAEVFERLADDQDNRGLDPLPAARLAVEASEGAVQAERTASTLAELGHARWSLAMAEAARGVDPLPALQLGEASLVEALRLKPGAANLYAELGALVSSRAGYESTHGLASAASFARAIAGYQRAAELQADVAAHRTNLGSAWSRRAGTERRAGLDPRASLEKAVAALEASLSLNPKNPYALGNLGNAWGRFAEVALDRGEDPAAPIAKARESYGRALEVNARHWQSHAGLGTCALLEARHLLAAGADPRPVLGKARAEWTLALAAKADDVDLLLSTAAGEQLEAEAALARRRSPAAALGAARKALAAVRRINPGAVHLAEREGFTALVAAKAAAQQGRSPLRDLDVADAALAQAALHYPTYAEVQRAIAEAQELRARCSGPRGCAPPLASR